LGRQLIIIFTAKEVTNDDRAISETFTVLPALSMVLIGFTIFFIIIATAYNSFDSKQDIINNFECCDKILEKICSPNSFFICEGNKIDLNLLISNEAETYLQQLQQQYKPYNLSFSVKVSYEDTFHWLPTIPQLHTPNMNKYASSRQVLIKLNEVSTIPGTITVVFWQKPS